jgi:hypothetical protein
MHFKFETAVRQFINACKLTFVATFNPNAGSNPTTTIYNASAVKIYNASAVKIYNASAVKIYNASAVKIYNATSSLCVFLLL